MKLNKSAIERAEVTGKQYFLWDDAVKGFGVRVSAQGAKAYIIQYRRDDGSKRRLTIAKVEKVNVKQARDRARELLAKSRLGGDPAEEKQQAKQKREADPTFKAFTEDRYFGVYVKRPRPEGGRQKKQISVDRDRYLLERFVYPAFGRKRISQIERKDVRDLHESMASTPYQANRTLAVLRKVLNLAEAEEMRPLNSNPCRHVSQYKEKPRRRYLTGKELSRLGTAIEAAEKAENEEEKISETAARLFRLLLLTGARVGELLSLKWEDIDFEHGVIDLADSKTGEKTIPLSAGAIKVLEDAPRELGNPYVHPGRRRNRKGEHTHMTNPAKPWNIVRTKAKLEDVRMHDCRHTFASFGARQGLGLPLIGAILGHTQAQTTQRYSHIDTDPLRRAADLISDDIQAALDKREEEGEVVKLEERRAK